MSTFLKGRRQFVSIDRVEGSCKINASSNTLDINIGVRQGSILGPFLYILYTNDLVSVLDTDCTSSFYADDASLIFTAKDSLAIENKCNTNLNNLLSWFAENSLF